MLFLICFLRAIKPSKGRVFFLLFLNGGFRILANSYEFSERLVDRRL